MKSLINIAHKWNGKNYVPRGLPKFKRRSKTFITKGAFGNQEWNKSIPENYNFSLTNKE